MEILISVAAKVAEYAVAPIQRQLNYLFHYKKNIKNHEEQLENLKTVRERVQILVNEARSNGDGINNDVSTWFNKVDVELPNMLQQNEENKKGSNVSCLNLVQRYQLSRKSTKKVEYILELINEGNMFNKVGHPAPLPVTRSSTLPADYQILESRTLMAEKIKDALADSSVNKVGVYGMGGVGKTKLLDEVKKLVLENKLFDQVIVVIVGQSNGILEIQDQIETQLNVKLNRKPKTEKGRALVLRNNLVEMNKLDNILIMLDDLWKDYDLENEIGIPCRLESRKEGCKILMTSRFRDLLKNRMNTETCFKVHFLSEEESWKFFMAIVGEFDKNCIERIAKDVVEQCGRLPLALKIIAKALKGKEVRIWKDALKQLKNPVSVNIDGVSDQMYSSLKLSYDWIKDEAQLLFHLCSVFPDDHNIQVKILQVYAMGMGLLKDIDNWEDARNRVFKLVDDLKSSSLLLESNSGDDYVKIHDVVRDVAKFIASNEDKRLSTLSCGYGQSEWQEKDRCGPYNAIFVDCENFSNLPPNLKFPNLQLLILNEPIWSKEFNLIWSKTITQIPNDFFEGMEKLRVLDMNMMCLEPSSLTSLTHSLKNLQTLCMSACECNDIDTIGQLKKLEILKIEGCAIRELPTTMSQLTQLKVLIVSACSNLKVIAQNIISSMTKLEELSLCWSFQRWGEEVSYKNELIKNVKLSELNCLTKLSNLRLEILNVDMMLDSWSLESAQKLEEFYIWVGHNPPYDFDECARQLIVNNIKWENVSIGGALQILLERCELLSIRHSVGFTKDIFHSHIDTNSDMPRRNNVQVALTKLKHLTIEGENNLEMLWHNNGLTANSFEKLQNICIKNCNKLKYIFPSNMVASLIALNTLEIGECELLERVFEIECLIGDAKKVPLTELRLSGLPNLKCMWNKDPGKFLTFPELKEVHVSDCPQLKRLFPASFIKHMKAIESLSAYEINEVFLEDEALKLELCDQIIVFPSLTSLEIGLKAMKTNMSSPKLHSLELDGSADDDIALSLEMSRVLYNIEEFKMQNAFQLIQVFSNQEESNHIQGRCAKLKKLQLCNLPNLTHVWKDNTRMTISFDCLKYIEVKNCDKLKYCLLPSSINFFNLVKLEVSDCNGMLNLFSSSVAKNLVNLREVGVYSCKIISSIVEVEGEREGGEECGEIIIFNQLSELKLHNLPRLANFYSGQCLLKFPCLEKLSIKECLEMKTFPYGIERQRRIDTGKWEDCEDEIGFSGLISLKIAWKEVQRSFKLTSDLFFKLKNLKSLVLIGSEDDDMVSFPLEMSQVLHNIEHFTVKNAFRLVHVFSNEDENNHIQGRHANLNCLKLYNLPNLKHVWKCNTGMTTRFDCLVFIRVKKCEKLKCLLPSSITFFNLVCIAVSDCNEMLNLFSSSVAKNLVKLWSIKISNCGGMNSIVAAEAEAEEENGEEIIFNHLVQLRLSNLPRLANFYSAKCSLKFPCLNNLSIKECPEMKTFSYGIISMPELEYIEIEEDVIEVLPTEDINVIIQDYWKDEIVRSIKNLFTQQGEEDCEDDTEDEP